MIDGRKAARKKLDGNAEADRETRPEDFPAVLPGNPHASPPTLPPLTILAD